MDEEKENQETRDEEVKRACGLLAAEDSRDCGDDGHDGGRHAQAGHDDQRKKNEDDDEIGQQLEDVVGLGFFFGGPLQAQMVQNAARNRVPGEIGPGWQQIPAEVPREEPGEEVSQAG